MRGAESRGGADENAADHGQNDDGEAVSGRDVFRPNDDAFPHSGQRKVNRDAAHDQADDAPNHWHAVIREQLDFLHVTPRM